MSKRKNLGFTIVELIVAITVLTLLTPVVIFTLGNYYEDSLNNIASSTQDNDVRQALATITNDLQDTRGFSASFSFPAGTTAPLGSTSGATGTGNWSYCGTGTTSTTCDGVTTDNGTTNRVLITYNDLTDGAPNSQSSRPVYINDGQTYNLSTAVPGKVAYIYFVAPDRNNASQNNLYRRTIVQVDPSTTDTYKSADSGLRATPFQKTSCASTVLSANSTVCKANDAVLLNNVKSFWIDYYDSSNQKIADYYTSNATTAATVASNIKSNAASVEVTITKQMSSLSKKTSQSSGLINVNSISASTASDTSPSYVTDSLVLYLNAGNSTSYPGTGTSWTNLATSGSNGTLTNGPTYSNGAIVFDGADDYVAVTLTKTSSCTFSVWAKTTSLATYPMLFNAGPIGTGPDLFFYGGVISWNTWDGAASSFGSSPASVTNGSWHNYVVVTDAVNNNTKLYYDNALLGTTTYKTPASSTTLSIGGAPTGYMWNGSIAIFMVHNKALSSTEITQNYNAQKSNFGL